MSVPAVVVRFPLEGAPRVYVDALNDEEAARLGDWLAARVEYADLVDRALALEEEARAA